MANIIQIERKVVEWRYRSLFGMTKVTWVLAPIRLETRNPNASRGVIRRANSRKALR